MKKNNFLIVVVLCVFLLHSVYAVIPQTLNLQGKLTNSSDDALTGTYNMTFRIYDVVTGGSSLWVSVNNSITTDGDGIYNFVLNDVNLSFDQEYYVGIKVESDAEMTPRINLTSTPYTFKTQNVSADGIINDSNVNLVGYNVTASSGLFSWLGSLLNRITKLFVQDIDFTGTINGSGWINTTANISADYYYGDGSKLTNLPSGGNLTWNESHAETLFAPNTTAGIQHLINDTGIYETYNATYDSYALNVSKNYTLDTYTNWGSNWYNHTSSVFSTWNSTWDESGWATDTFLSISNSGWNRSGTDVFLGYTGDSVGIGTDSPSQKLDVRGQGNFSGTIYINNATDISTWEANVSRNWTLDAFNTWGSNWYNHTLSTFDTYNSTWDNNWVNVFAYNHTLSTFNTWNSTWDESGWVTDTFLSIANSGWNRSGTNVFLGYTGDSVGIGTDNPTHKLSVVGTFNTTSAGSSLVVDANGNIKIGI